MFTALPNTKLSTGETVEGVVVRGPDLDWAERIEDLLHHKGELWEWQNTQLLRNATGVAANFFLLHRGGVPFANIMVVETEGTALLGHVWTEPVDQRKGASSRLMDLALKDFVEHGGRAMFLGAGFDSVPFHYYRRRGFEPVEPGSGYMSRYAQSREEFERTWFGATEAVMEPLDWKHWPASSALFLGSFPGVVRIAATRLIGRVSEGPVLTLLRDSLGRRAQGEMPAAWALRDATGAALLGLASRCPHPLWPETDIVDIFCHPRWWHRAPDLLAKLPHSANRSVAYCDTNHDIKRRVLNDAGYAEQSVLPQWAFADAMKSVRVDVAVLSDQKLEDRCIAR